MNKKICAAMLGLFAFGVSADQQVTDDMLIGKWICNDITYKSAKYDKNGNKSEYENIPSREQRYLTYEIKDNKLIVISNGKASLVGLSKNPPEKLSDYGDGTVVELDIDESYTFISDNEFNMRYIVTKQIKSPRIPMEEFYIEQSCSRSFE